MTASVTPANSTVLAASTGSRRGTAVKVARTMPVAYSPVMSRTPSTPTASWATLTPSLRRGLCLEPELRIDRRDKGGEHNIALATLLGIGSALHNATEGFGTVAPPGGDEADRRAGGS
jgi:hypothetical protein